MTNRGELRTMVRMRLGDIAEAPILTDTQLNQWINDSIREYSVHFPRQAELRFACSAGEREYTLDGRTDESGEMVLGTQAVWRVAYLIGENPPQILLRRSELDGRGFSGELVYDVQQSPQFTLILGPLPRGTETIGVIVLCDHPLLDQDTDVLSLPEHHLELVILFIRLLALQELAASEACDPSSTGVILTGLTTMLSHAKDDYTTTLAMYQKRSSPGGFMTSWGSEIDVGEGSER